MTAVVEMSPIVEEALQGILMPDEVDLASLGIDTSYQREVSALRAKRIAQAFNPFCLQVLLVGRRKDDSLWIVDGQTRRQALMMLGIQKAWAMLFDSSGPEEEANIFRIINLERKAITPLERFHACIAAKDPTSLAIQEELDICGARLSKGSNNWTCAGVISLKCVAVVQDLYQWKVLKRTLDCIRESFENREDRFRNAATQGDFLKAVGYVLSRCKSLNYSRWVSILQECIPNDLRSVPVAKGEGSTRHIVTAKALLERYNKRLTNNRVQLSKTPKKAGRSPAGNKEGDSNV